MVLERGFLSDVTVPISDLSKRSLEYPRMHYSQAQGMDFSARVSNLGTDTATNVVVMLELEQNDVLQGTFVSDTVPIWPPGYVDTVVIAADWDAPAFANVELVFGANAVELDLDEANNIDSLTLELTYDRMSRTKGAYTGSLEFPLDGYTFVAARFEILYEGSTCAIGCVIPNSTSNIGAVMGAAVFDEDLNPLVEAIEIGISAGYLSDPGEEIIIWIWLENDIALQPGHDYYAGIALFGGTDTPSIATQGTAGDSSALVFDYSLWSWTYTNELPMITLAQEGFMCVGAISDPSSSLTDVTSIPNPCSTATTIHYDLSRSAPISISINDLSGKERMMMHEWNKGPGQHSTNINTGTLPPGLYCVRITAGTEQVSQRLVVIP